MVVFGANPAIRLYLTCRWRAD